MEMKNFYKIIFYTCFYSTTFLLVVMSLPFLILPKKFLKFPIKTWSVILSWLLLKCFKIDFKIRGKFQNHQVIYAIKHQSIWETIVLTDKIPGMPSIIMKKELMQIPIIGLLFKHSGAIPLDRGQKIQSIRRLLSQTQKALNRGDSLIIYPQGTRIEPGIKRKYLSGIYAIYNQTNLPVLPIALNSGKYWRKGYLKGPGCIEVSLLNIIKPGLKRKKFMEDLENSIENESNMLL